MERPLFHVWPTPGAWLLSGLAGVALVVVLLLVAEVGEAVAAGEAPLRTALRRAVDTVLPIPRVLGSRYVGSGVLVASWLLGQLLMGTTLRHRPTWRPGVVAVAAVTVATTAAVLAIALG